MKKEVRGPRHKVPLDGSKLDHLRKEAALSIVDLAAAAEVSPSSVKRAIKKGRAEVSIFTAEQILSALEEKLQVVNLIEQVRVRAEETEQKLKHAVSNAHPDRPRLFRFSNTDINYRFEDIWTFVEVAIAAIVAQTGVALAADKHLLWQAVQAIYGDVERFKTYHLGGDPQKFVARYRTAAFSAIWISRFKPIRLVREESTTTTEEERIQELAFQVNEIVGLKVAFAQMGTPIGELETGSFLELVHYVAQRTADPNGLAIIFRMIQARAQPERS